MSHIPPLPPDRLTDEQRPLHEDMAASVRRMFPSVSNVNDEGALLGPFPPMLHFPEFGEPTWTFSKALAVNATLPKNVREVVILVTGAAFRARYELYAHEQVAADAGLSAPTIAALVAGQRPAELTADETVAHDLAAALMRGGSVPAATYRAAVNAFGEHGAAELIYLAGNYTLISVLLNAYDTDVPPTG